jgi:hypothetical protein
LSDGARGAYWKEELNSFLKNIARCSKERRKEEKRGKEEEKGFDLLQ